MALPKDPFILFSTVNTKLRDHYSSLDDLCDDLEEDREAIICILSSAGFKYDEQLNQFI